MDLIERTFQREGSLYIACDDKNPFFTSGGGGGGWSGGAKVLGKLPVPGRPTIWIQ